MKYTTPEVEFVAIETADVMISSYELPEEEL